MTQEDKREFIEKILKKTFSRGFKVGVTFCFILGSLIYLFFNNANASTISATVKDNPCNVCMAECKSICK